MTLNNLLPVQTSTPGRKVSVPEEPIDKWMVCDKRERKPENEFPLHSLSYLSCDGMFELVLSSYHLVCFLHYFFPHFHYFCKREQWYSVHQLKSPWATTASSSVHFIHKSIIFHVTGVQLTLLVAIFTLTPSLLRWTVRADFYFLAGGSKMQFSHNIKSNQYSSLCS